MNKSEAQKVLFECAELYKNNLIDYNLLFLCAGKNRKMNALEMQFSTTGFLHLTGVKFPGKKIPARAFFDKCINRRLSLAEFDLALDGTTELKLKILPLLFQKNLSASMIGDFSARTSLLVDVYKRQVPQHGGRRPGISSYLSLVFYKEDHRWKQQITTKYHTSESRWRAAVSCLWAWRRRALSCSPQGSGWA